MPFFGSYPIPPEVVIDRDAAMLARPRIDPTAWLDTYVVEEAVAAATERRAAQPRSRAVRGDRAANG
jgi:hypothetical protein